MIVIKTGMHRVSPAGYNLPFEYTKLAEECSRCEEDRVWICKPVGQSQGRGIFLFRVSIVQPFRRWANRSGSVVSFSETERPHVRQLDNRAKVHREPTSDRRLQVRFETVRVRALVSSISDILVQGRLDAFRHGEVLLGTLE